MCLVFCFFKQKTAYEMRISDWSSDVCSSDLGEGGQGLDGGGADVGVAAHELGDHAVLDAEDVVVHEHLAVAVPAGADADGGDVDGVGDHAGHGVEIGCASCREGVCQYV